MESFSNILQILWKPPKNSVCVSTLNSFWGERPRVLLRVAGYFCLTPIFFWMSIFLTLGFAPQGFLSTLAVGVGFWAPRVPQTAGGARSKLTLKLPNKSLQKQFWGNSEPDFGASCPNHVLACPAHSYPTQPHPTLRHCKLFCGHFAKIIQLFGLRKQISTRNKLWSWWGLCPPPHRISDFGVMVPPGTPPQG